PAGKILAEIAVSGSRQTGATNKGGRNGGQHGASGVSPGSLIVAKEKNLVFLDGAPNRTAELVPLCAGNEPVGDGIPLGLREGIAGLSGIAAAKFKQAAMEAVVARFCLGAYHPRDRPAKFSVIIL